ncbi:hypothetical protein C8R43DRAFT_509670 [Mycena crocata]|nr:hypothetical protein C8R43DRAFT_509670 [Mycena crocata]
MLTNGGKLHSRNGTSSNSRLAPPLPPLHLSLPLFLFFLSCAPAEIVTLSLLFVPATEFSVLLDTCNQRCSLLICFSFNVLYICVLCSAHQNHVHFQI